MFFQLNFRGATEGLNIVESELQIEDNHKDLWLSWSAHVEMRVEKQKIFLFISARRSNLICIKHCRFFFILSFNSVCFHQICEMDRLEWSAEVLQKLKWNWYYTASYFPLKVVTYQQSFKNENIIAIFFCRTKLNPKYQPSIAGTRESESWRKWGSERGRQGSFIAAEVANALHRHVDWWIPVISVICTPALLTKFQFPPNCYLGFFQTEFCSSRMVHFFQLTSNCCI